MPNEWKLPDINVQKFVNPQILKYLPILTLVVGFLGGVYFSNSSDQADGGQVIREDESNYTYINPLIECETSTFKDYDTLNSLRHDISEFTENEKNEGKIDYASVYFRDLNNGPWFEINVEEKFSPASLIKVPLMMAYYKMAEEDPSVLTKMVPVTDVSSYGDQNILPEEKLVVGKSYSIEELIERMITYSDNVAYNLLNDNIDPELIFEIYDDMGIDIRTASKEDPNGNIINVKDYSAFFRVLFNSSYLNPDSSEKVLALMTKTDFKEGLAAGVDPSTEVSHKYGERFYTFSGVRQLHDCGIIYGPNRPYLLCVMTRGTNLESLEDYISSVSRMVAAKQVEINNDIEEN